MLRAPVRFVCAGLGTEIERHRQQDRIRLRHCQLERADQLRLILGREIMNVIQPGDKLEESLRELLYLVLSTPEYQLG